MCNKFSITTSCYNNGPFLNQFFESIVNQTYGFEENIEIIILDDNSSDNSGEVIKKWQELYPNNIKTLKTKGIRQSLCRNIAMKMAKHEWISFLDCDDFINYDYFKNINIAINENTECKLFTAKVIAYWEDKNLYKNNGYHWQYLEKGKNAIVDFSVSYNGVPFSASASVISRDIVLSNDLEFWEIYPAFEDTNFVLRYTELLHKKIVCFCIGVEYFYRKSLKYQSTTYKLIDNPDYYSNVFKNGVLPYLKSFDNRKIPEYIQKIILEISQWHLSVGLNMDEYRVEKIGKEILLECYNHFKEMFSYMDSDLILEWKKFYTEDTFVAIALNFKNELIPGAKLVKFSHKSAEHYIIEIKAKKYDAVYVMKDGIKIDINEFHTAKIEYSLFENRGFYKIKLYLPYHPSNIEGIIIEDEIIEVNMPSNYYELPTIKRSKPVLLFMDRFTAADDNAEILYSWIETNYPEKFDMYFALDIKSKDFKRLFELGYNVINLYSQVFTNIYNTCDYFFSSQDYNFGNLKFTNNPYPAYKFVFLQHGILDVDLRNYFFSKKIDYFVTTGELEKSIIADVFPLEIIDTGLPRLSRDYIDKGNDILFAPGWSIKLSRMSDDELVSSTKFNIIRTILSSTKLHKYLEKYSKNIYVKIHPNLAKKIKIEDFHPNIIKVDMSYAKVFSMTSKVITDYSSVFIDNFFNNGHIHFIQLDDQEYYEGHVAKKVDHWDSYGQVHKSVNSLINAITSNEDIYIPKIEKNRRNLQEKFKKEEICNNIVKIVLGEYI